MKNFEGKIIYQGKTKKGLPITVRYLSKDDIQKMWKLINALSQERTFITYQGEKITLIEEAKYLKSKLEKIAEKKCIQLMAFSDNKLLGTANIDMKDKVARHIGNFGIIIAKKYRGQGIGKLLMKLALDEAVKNIPDLEIVVLQVFANNSLAHKMYKKFGFVDYGRLPNGIKLEEGYRDDIFMFKNVKKE